MYKILKLNQYMKSNQMPYIIYADMESLIKKTNGCANNAENSSKTKTGEHIRCVYSMSTIWNFDNIENKRTLYREEDCMKNFSTSLREQMKNTIAFEKKKMLRLTKNELKSREDTKLRYICEKRILQKLSKSIDSLKLRDHCHYTGKYRDLNFKMTKTVRSCSH